MGLLPGLARRSPGSTSSASVVTSKRAVYSLKDDKRIINGPLPLCRASAGNHGSCIHR